ncbi:hypothetical protein V8E36_008782 [Tilletia maclaganii]
MSPLLTDNIITMSDYNFSIDPSLIERTDNNNTPHPLTFITNTPANPNLQAFGIQHSDLYAFFSPPPPSSTAPPSSGHSDSFSTSYVEPSLSYESAVFYVFNRLQHMEESARRGWFLYIQPFIQEDINQLINQATTQLQQQVEQLTLDKEGLDRALRRQVRLSAQQFDFPATAAWSQREYDAGEFRTMNHRTGRKLAAELMLAADGDMHHPTILANPIHYKCLERFWTTSQH